MNSTDPRPLADRSAHAAARYTAQTIAQAHSVAESTVRTRWFEWISRVAPVALLKDERGYSELARSLFAEFATVDRRDRTAWVTDAKARYAHEWGGAGVIEGELMPDSVGNALALHQTHTSLLQHTTAQTLADLDALMGQLAVTENDFSSAELAAFQAAGRRRGALRFQVELQAELDTYSNLKQQRLQG
ncbi:MAG: hypothetical protein AAFY78_22870 [Cyanobacteria bacterium J06648_16]